MTQPILGWNREKSGNRNRKRVDREFTKEFAASVCVRCPSRRNERFIWLRTVRRNFEEDEQEEKKKGKEKYKNFRYNDKIDLKVKEKLEKQLAEQQLVTDELSSIVAGEMFTEDCRTFIFGILTTYWR